MDIGQKKNFQFLIGVQTKIHQSRENLKFLNTCKMEGLEPKFTHFTKSTLKDVNWSRHTIHQKRMEKISHEITSQNDRLKYNTDKFYNFLNLNFNYLSKTKMRNIMFSVKKIVENSQTKNDLKRAQKLENLRFKKNPNYETIKILNFSEVNIPQNIIKILQYGTEKPVGGTPNSFQLMKEMEKLLKVWTKYARECGVSPMEIFTLKGDLIHSFKLLTKCFPGNNDAKVLKEFLNQNSDIVLVKADKTKSLVFMNSVDYVHKLTEQFPSDKYIKLEKDPLNADLKSYQKLIRKMGPYLSREDKFKIRPISSLKSAYGLVKLHKGPNNPLRPIVSSLNSLVSGSEKYLINILNKFLPRCTFSLESTKKFSEFFMNNRDKFNAPGVDIFSLDVCSLFPSVDLEFTCQYIVDEIYKKPGDYFTRHFDEESGEDVQFPPRVIFEEYFNGVIRKFTSFRSRAGWYKQSYVLSMGSALSPILANIFMMLVETRILQPLMESGMVIAYKRYVDDIFLCLRSTEDRDYVYNLFNTAHKGLSFTIDLPSENGLAFLDTQIYYSSKNNKWEMRQFSKKIKDRVVQNFKESVSPFHHRNGVLTGEIYRANNCTSNTDDLKVALDDLTEKFLANGFPKSLILDKIQEVKNRKFCKKISETDYERDKSENPNKYFTFCANYTGPRCQKIASKIRNFLTAVTPQFKINFAWRSITLDSIVLPKLKKGIDNLDKSGIVYEFRCNCNLKYIGKTCRQLNVRASEHGMRSYKRRFLITFLSVRNIKLISYNLTRIQIRKIRKHFC